MYRRHGLIYNRKVAYLLGAGATQAEISYGGIEAYTQMDEINKNVSQMSEEIGGKYYSLLKRFSIPLDQDVEWMMSLLEGFTEPGDPVFKEIYTELRKLFRRYLVTQICSRKIEPKLISSLLHVHKNYNEYMGENGEKLLGVLTTNYDSLIEEAFSMVYDGLNVGFEFESNSYKIAQTIPLLKLHGSFNWKIQDDNLKISRDFELGESQEEGGGWIPPSVYKKPTKKIFVKIWKKARDLLINCNTLRVIGSSMRNEDWALISLIFTSQILSEPTFDIELIVPDEVAKGREGQQGIMDRLRFLGNVKNLTSLPIIEPDETPGNNVFYYWLLKKIDEIRGKNVKINRDEFIRNMIYGGQ